MHYTSRADKFDDPFEGMYSKANLDKLMPNNNEERKVMYEDLKNTQRIAKDYLRINCWNMSTHESPGLWGRYGKDTVSLYNPLSND